MIEKKGFNESVLKVNESIENYFASKILNAVAGESVFTKYIKVNNYNWFEKLFCKNIIAAIEKLQVDKGKEVKWERYIDMKGGNNETLLDKSNSGSASRKRSRINNRKRNRD